MMHRVYNSLGDMETSEFDDLLEASLNYALNNCLDGSLSAAINSLDKDDLKKLLGMVGVAFIAKENNMTKTELLESIACIQRKRGSTPESIAQDILSVQPMTDSLKGLFDAGQTHEELISQGYSPVSRMGLLYVKDEE